MRNRGILILTAVTAIAVGYAVFDVQSEKKQETLKAEKSRLVPFLADQINGIEIHSGQPNRLQKQGESLISNRIRLTRDADGWRFEEPLQERADSTAVQDFVEGLANEKFEQVIAKGPEVDWKIYGLDEPRGSIVVQNNLGEQKKFWISSKKNFQGEAFLRLDQEDQVLLASGTWFAKIEKKPLDFRDKRILRKAVSLITGLNLQNGSNRLNLERKDNVWSSPDQPQWNLDQNKVREFLTFLGGANVLEYVTDSSPDPQSLKSWGLASPKAILTVKFENNPDLKFLMGEDSNRNQFLLMPEPSRVVKLNVSDSVKLSGLRLLDLRDRRGPFDFKRTVVRKMLIRVGSQDSEIDWKDNSWQVTRKTDEQLKVDNLRAATFLTKVAELEVSDFLDGQKTTFKPEESVVLKDEKDQIMLSLEISAAQKEKKSGVETQFRLARSNQFPNVFRIDEEKWKTLKIEELVRGAHP